MSDYVYDDSPISIGLSSPENTIAIFNSPVTNRGEIQIDLASTGVVPGRYNSPSFSVNKYGQIVTIFNDGKAPLSSITFDSNTLIISNKHLTRNNSSTDINLTPIYLDDIEEQIFDNPSISVDKYGRVISISSKQPLPGQGTVKSVSLKSATLEVSVLPVTGSGSLTANLRLIPSLVAGEYANPSIKVDKYGRIIEISKSTNDNLISPLGTLDIHKSAVDGSISIDLSSNPSSEGLTTYKNITSITYNQFGQVVGVVGDIVTVIAAGTIVDPYYNEIIKNYTVDIEVTGMLPTDYVFLSPCLQDATLGMQPIDSNACLSPSLVNRRSNGFVVTSMKKPTAGTVFSYNYCILRNKSETAGHTLWSVMGSGTAIQSVFEYGPSTGYVSEAITVSGLLSTDLVFVTPCASNSTAFMQTAPISGNAVPAPCLSVVSVSAGSFKVNRMSKPEEGVMSFNYFWIRNKENVGTKNITHFSSVADPYAGINSTAKQFVLGLTEANKVFLAPSISDGQYGFRKANVYGALQPSITKTDKNFFSYSVMEQPKDRSLASYDFLVI